ncbi:MAG: phosphatase PAP2 family protein [Rhodocyclaceae bacterium]|nr:phosphatase PAP2 family protein [Rhodocyclaceae bacterium]
MLFWLAPGLDIAVSSFFYRPGEGFFLRDSRWARFFYVVSPPFVWSWVGIAAGLALLSLAPRFARLRRPALFVIATILLGPGLIVSLFKDHWGRARPVEIVEFGGTARFTPAWVPSDQCRENCSFVGGHAAGAFSLMALAWAMPRQRRFWLLAGMFWGAHMGLVRIAQGGHFLSDIVFAGFIVYFTAALLARWVFYRPADAPT